MCHFGEDVIGSLNILSQTYYSSESILPCGLNSHITENLLVMKVVWLSLNSTEADILSLSHLTQSSLGSSCQLKGQPMLTK